MHRFLLSPKDNEIVDHINGNGLDNRKSNLRLCTPSQNNQNFRIKKTSKSGYKGVCWHKASKKWRVTIKTVYKQVSGGYFSDKKEAALKYNELASKYFGEFARLNIL